MLPDGQVVWNQNRTDNGKYNQNNLSDQKTSIVKEFGYEWNQTAIASLHKNELPDCHTDLLGFDICAFLEQVCA